MLKLHGAAAMAGLIIYGSLLPVHIRRAWTIRRNIFLGISLVVLMLLLTINGYLLRYFGGEEARPIISATHWILGVGVPALLAWHFISEKRRTRIADRFKRISAPFWFLRVMTLDIRWFAPAAIVAMVSADCIAVPYMSFAQAQALIFPEAKEFVAAPMTVTAEQIARVEKQSGVKVSSPNQRVWLAQVEGKTIGWFIIDDVLGKKELMIYGVGIGLDGAVRQIQIINYRENYGYEVKGAKWREQFVGKTLADPLELTVDIKNISGSTLSSRHVTEGVKRLLAFHQVVLRQ